MAPSVLVSEVVVVVVVVEDGFVSFVAVAGVVVVFAAAVVAASSVFDGGGCNVCTYRSKCPTLLPLKKMAMVSIRTSTSGEAGHKVVLLYEGDSALVIVTRVDINASLLSVSASST